MNKNSIIIGVLTSCLFMYQYIRKSRYHRYLEKNTGEVLINCDDGGIDDILIKTDKVNNYVMRKDKIIVNKLKSINKNGKIQKKEFYINPMMTITKIPASIKKCNNETMDYFADLDFISFYSYYYIKSSYCFLSFSIYEI